MALTPAPLLAQVEPLLAQVEQGVLLRSLAIAVVLVAPFGWYQVRKVRRLRAERAAAAAAAAAAASPVEPVAQRPRLEDVVATVEQLAADLPAGGTGTVTVPAEVTVDGKDVTPPVIDALVRDALRRSGLVATAELDGPAGRTIECRRA